MTSDKDQLLTNLFAEASRTELPDNGFSRRVMRSLPTRPERLLRLWSMFCLVVGVVLLVAIGFWRHMMTFAVELTRAFVNAQMPSAEMLVWPVLLAVAIGFVVNEMTMRMES